MTPSVLNVLSCYVKENGVRFIYEGKPSKVVQGNDQCFRRDLNNRHKYKMIKKSLCTWRLQ